MTEENKQVITVLYNQLRYAHSYQINRIKREIKRILLKETEADNVFFLYSTKGQEE